MTGVFEQADLGKVNFALTKLGSAYASKRISLALYRQQRALLIQHVTNAYSAFPALILNEYSQMSHSQFEPELTPVLSGQEHRYTPSIDQMAPQSYQQERVFMMASDDQQPQFSAGPTRFERYYWFYLVVFLSAVALFVFTRPY